MLKEGVVADELLPMLLRDYQERVREVVALMVKFNLLVPLSDGTMNGLRPAAQAGGGAGPGPTANRVRADVAEYIAPAHLPSQLPHQMTIGELVPQ